MSLVSTFVQAVDGKFYQDPVIEGDGWFVCFDDDEPPEFVVAVPMREPPWETMGRTGIPYKNVRGSGRGGSRLFGAKWKIKAARSYYFDLVGPIPIPTRHGGAFTQSELKGRDRVTYEFKEKTEAGHG